VTANDFFGIQSACRDCPFRRDVPGFLTQQRAQQIAAELLDDCTSFHCHKTVDYAGDGTPDVSQAQHCAGAAIVLWKESRPNVAMRIAMMCGGLAGDITPEAAQHDDTCMASLAAFVGHHAGGRD
jgi:hypothetical protein